MVSKCKFCKKVISIEQVYCSGKCKKARTAITELTESRRNESRLKAVNHALRSRISNRPPRGRRKKEREIRTKLARKTEEFYRSKEWLILRYQVLRDRGKKCEACGSESPPFHVDHIKPRSKYPDLSLTYGNLQVLCKSCNLGKGAWDETDWRKNDFSNSHC